LVLLDLMMPGVNGWEVLARMQADERLREIPVCIVSAVVDRCPPGATKVLSKPVRLAELLNTIAEHC
jgi:CheY-like chemotaxis protein